MLIAQITDIHIDCKRPEIGAANARRLKAVLDALAAMSPRPDLVVATGDLTEHGVREEYEQLRTLLEAAPFSVHLCLGNHDRRAAFQEVFERMHLDGGYLQYAVHSQPARLVVVDTLEEGRHGGAFDAARTEWLDRTLADAPDTPTVIAAHHPPIPTGIAWMTAAPDADWARRFERVVRRHRQVRLVISGHVHRTLCRPWGGALVSVSPAVAAQVALDFAPMDPARPDGRALLVDEPPGYALHWWDGSAFASHTAIASDARVLVRFDAGMQPVVAGIIGERLGDKPV